MENFNQLSKKIVHNLPKINNILSNASIDSHLTTNEFEKTLKTIENQNIRTSTPNTDNNQRHLDSIPSCQEIDQLFEALRQRPKQMIKLGQKKLSNPQLSSTFMFQKPADETTVSTPRKQSDPNEIILSVRANQHLLRSIRSESIESVDLMQVADSQKKILARLQQTIADYQNVCQNLENNTANVSKGNQSCPVDKHFNDSLKQLTKAMTNVTFIKSNEVLPEIKEEQTKIQSLPLSTCFDDIIEEIRSNDVKVEWDHSTVRNA